MTHVARASFSRKNSSSRCSTVSGERRIRDDEQVDVDGLLLANAVDPMGCLFSLGRVPPPRVTDDVVGTRHVEPEAVPSSRENEHVKTLGSVKLVGGLDSLG